MQSSVLLWIRKRGALIQNKYKILIVEDDVNIRNIVSTILETSGYQVLLAKSCAMAKTIFASHLPDLIILDVMLPDEDGLSIVKKIRSNPESRKIPVIMVTAKTTELDKVKGLDMGADDYLTKPCNMERLLARIKNLLRRSKGQQGLLDGNGFLLDPHTYTIYVDQKSYLLSQNEGKILRALLQNSPNVVTKAELCLELWGTDEFIDENALQVNLTRLRKTLRSMQLDQRVETVRGLGYRLREQGEL